MATMQSPQAILISALLIPIISLPMLIPLGIISIRNQDAKCDKPLEAWALTSFIVALCTTVANFFISLWLFAALKCCGQYESVGDNDDPQQAWTVRLPKFINSLITQVTGLFWLVWYIVGMVWVSHCDHGDGTGCPDELYYLVMVLGIIFFSLMGAACLCFCCSIVLFLAYAATNNSNN
eukprot:TRINITY_DN1598_c0_g1_i1.p1 TRINITY_DN1598_c0_g1~~TRINITY_DN1598_c0_g1_i1.p1  ORF type:complete len:195 (-),score=34.30 TRINITY_DN1598_c0_g1_i1:165-701(-)